MIILECHSPNWAIYYRTEAAKLRALLGVDLLAIEHIGSTAIPSIRAKPVIDIMLGVRQLPPGNSSIVQRLITAGFQHEASVGLYLPDCHFFVRKASGLTPQVHLHLTEHDKTFWRRHIEFRDYLREHTEVAKQYESLKLELADQYRCSQAYSQAKGDFVGKIEKLAKQHYQRS